MNLDDTIHFKRISEALDYIRLHIKEQPGLDEVAEKLNLSPFHFQRLFTEWAGVSPKKFLQYLSVEYAKDLLSEKKATLFDTAAELGLSGTGRLHDLFINIEGMTPGEFKNGGKKLHIKYAFEETIFGTVLVASTAMGVCYLGFADDRELTLHELFTQFPNATYEEKSDLFQQQALSLFKRDWSHTAQIRFHLKGTPFQIKVWESLLKIPQGNLTTYGRIAQSIAHPSASRAVGSAVGANPIAFIIPCHRVIQASGVIGQYHWGSTRKSLLIGWEAAGIMK